MIGIIIIIYTLSQLLKLGTAHLQYHLFNFHPFTYRSIHSLSIQFINHFHSLFNQQQPHLSSSTTSPTRYISTMQIFNHIFIHELFYIIISYNYVCVFLFLHFCSPSSKKQQSLEIDMLIQNFSTQTIRRTTPILYST